MEYFGFNALTSKRILFWILFPLLVFITPRVYLDNPSLVLTTSIDDLCVNGKEVHSSCRSTDIDAFAKTERQVSFCGSGSRCCPAEMEEMLLSRSREEFIQTLINITQSSVDVFNFSRTRFDDFFTKLLSQSSVDLHNMFVKTYGLLYQQNSDIFVDLFDNLQRYYRGSKIRLSDALDQFFSTLMQRIFILLNVQHEFDDVYLACISDNVGRIKPFGDVPSMLLQQIRRSFVAAKTFLHGLMVGHDVLEVVSEVRMTEPCIGSVARMLHCSHCNGLPCAKPCKKYCLNIASKCLDALYSDLSVDWIAFIDELVRVSERLEGPFNIENVVDPIEVKISDAIMNFQANYDGLLSQIFSECGQPESKTDRRKRSLAAASNQTTTRTKHTAKPGKGRGMQLGRLVREIRSQIQKTRFFWKRLANAACEDLAVANSSCWNGISLLNKYSPVIFEDSGHLPEVDFQSISAVNQKSVDLRAMTLKLKMAANGLEFSWSSSSDREDGSGSGSGDDADEQEEDEESGQEDFDGLGFKRQTATVTLRTNTKSSVKDQFHQLSSSYSFFVSHSHLAFQLSFVIVVFVCDIRLCFV